MTTLQAYLRQRPTSNDIVSFLPPDCTARPEDQFDLFQGSGGTEGYPFRLNPSMAPFDNQLIRQGLKYAISRQRIVDVAMNTKVSDIPINRDDVVRPEKAQMPA